MTNFRLLGFTIALSACAQDITVAGLARPVEILRDRWGIPHIYAQTADDLFFAQGYVTAKDRLFQIDLWRRIGTGKLAEVLGPTAAPRDRIARLVRFRGDWDKEWASYSPDARQIATAFTRGINAYIRSLGQQRPIEFQIAGYGPGMWEPEDVVARIAGLLMTRNLTREVQRAQDIQRFGLDTVQRYLPPDPPIRITIPKDLDLAGITNAILKDYNEAIGAVTFPEQRVSSYWGSNNWVVAGSRSLTGKPLLANDPHRPINIPSLRKTVHLVGPGWNVIGAGEPALPGIALGHNEEIAFGFTIVGIDQGDLYVEKLNPADPDEYLYQGKWRKMTVIKEAVPVRGQPRPWNVELRFTHHGPVIAEDLGKHRAYALRWVGSEPGGAGYLSALRVSRARNWTEFQEAVALYKVPSENLVYADRAGNIGWIAAGLAPIRKNWSGLLPVPGHTGEYEWDGFLPPSENPRQFNPPEGAIGTANHNILPQGYPHQLSYEWAAPFRIGRVREMLLERMKFDVNDFQRMQQDVHSHSARLFQAILRRWMRKPGELDDKEERIVRHMTRNWNATLRADSWEALLFETWTGKLHPLLFGRALSGRVDHLMLLQTLEQNFNAREVTRGLRLALRDLEGAYGPDLKNWQWGLLHTVTFRHPLNRRELHRGPFPRPGDGNTVNSTSGPAYRQTAGASYRQIIDLSNWDQSVMTNVPGEVGDPRSQHYDDLIDEWLNGQYHPMLYTRKAVEAATIERIRLLPAN
jgi:penicillin amidase